MFHQTSFHGELHNIQFHLKNKLDSSRQLVLFLYIYILPLLPKIFLTFFSLRYTHQYTDETIIYFTFLLHYIQQHTNEKQIISSPFHFTTRNNTDEKQTFLQNFIIKQQEMYFLKVCSTVFVFTQACTTKVLGIFMFLVFLSKKQEISVTERRIRSYLQQ